MTSGPPLLEFREVSRLYGDGDSLVRALDGQSTPVLVFRDGKEVARHVGATSKQRLQQLLRA